MILINILGDNMVQNLIDLYNLTNEFDEYKKELLSLLEFSKNNNVKLEEYYVELNSLKKELNSVKEINNKTKEFLLLELESNLDKQRMALNKQNSKVDSFKEVISLLKEENNDKLEEISYLNIELSKYKQNLDDKNNLIDSLQKKKHNLTKLMC